MCGIVGIVGADRSCQVDSASIHHMCQTIVHRGPDDEGIYAKGCAGLGMRRLSIIDLCSGQQPIHNEDRNIWIVFNGEIYNFPELRPELEANGHRFYTNSDTEVIVHLYEQYGADCVNRLRGMFAFAVWDESKQVLLLARDRFGKKPLHYALSKDRLIFGSEMKALLAVAPELSEINSEAVLNFFSFGYIPDPLSGFKQIHKLPPGHVLEFNGGQIRIRQYWDLPAYAQYEPRDEEECLLELERQLAEAVRIRLISDVPLGALLSGGVDSSTIVALMSRFSHKVKTFSIGFSRQDFNEADHARLVAQTFGTDHHELFVEPDIEQTVDQLTHSLEEPFGDSSIVPTYHVCRMARQHVTVVLAGDGGDELLGGYQRYESHLRRRRIHNLPFFLPKTGDWYRTRVHPLIPPSMFGRRFIFNLSLPARDRYLDAISILPAARERALFSPEFLACVENDPSPYHRFQEYIHAQRKSDALSQILYVDTKTYLPGDILTKVDRMSMATSLEVRAPLLDHCFAEWVTRLSSKWKIRSGESKYILKKLAQRLGVPHQTLYRKKQGFSMPLVHWFRQQPMPALLEILLEPKTIQRGYFNEREVRRQVIEHRKGLRDRSYELWHLLVFELWHRNFLEPAKQARVPDQCRTALLFGGKTLLAAEKSAVAEVA